MLCPDVFLFILCVSNFFVWCFSSSSVFFLDELFIWWKDNPELRAFFILYEVFRKRMCSKVQGRGGGLHPQPRAQNKIVALERPSRTRYLGAQLCNYKTVLTYTNKQWGGGGRRAPSRKKPICLKRQAWNMENNVKKNVKNTDFWGNLSTLSVF